jgi:hypothetical protein
MSRFCSPSAPLLAATMLLMLACLCSTAAPDHQRVALVDLFQSTDGASWTDNTNWLQGDPCQNNWFGIMCDASDSHVTAIFLANNNLQGKLPMSISWIDTLNSLTVSGNNLQDAIPVSITTLFELQNLYLDENKFSGPVPEFSNSQPRLVNLYVSNRERESQRESQRERERVKEI